MPLFEEKPKGMSYAEWMRSKNISFTMKIGIHEDSGLPKDYISSRKTNEVFEHNKKRQGGEIKPEDM